MRLVAARGAAPSRAARCRSSRDVVLDTVRQDPGPSARRPRGPVLRPHRAAPLPSAGTIEMPALVIGHPRDPVHPFSDAGMLADELPNGAAARGELDPRAAPRARAPDRARSPTSSTSAGRPSAHAAAAA